MGLEAATKALLDAGRAVLHAIGVSSRSSSGITYDSIEAAHVGYCYGDSTSGQVPIFPQAALRNAELMISVHCIISG